MEKTRSQHYNYSFEAIPILFHSQTDGFMKYLEKDGVKFLRFWWDHVGDKLEEAQRVPWRGLDFEIEVLDGKRKLVWIILPKPSHDEEAYFLGLLASPEQRFAWVRLPNTRVFVLRRWDNLPEPPRTLFGELTPRALFRKLGEGIEPNKEAFKEAVRRTVRRKGR